MNDLPVQVLLIEDNPGDARLLREMLNEPGSFRAELTHVECLSDALLHLRTSLPLVILLDLGLPDAHGLDAVRQVHAAAPNVPLVVLTGLDDASLATQALQEGAQDYLVKGQNNTLFRALSYAMERQRMLVETEQVRALQLHLKDEFLSHVSHELRSPLTAIYQFGTILEDELVGPLNSEQREHVQIILRNVGQLQSMIGDLLDVTRAHDGKLAIDPQRTSISDAILFTVKTMQGAAGAKGIRLWFDAPSSSPPAYADPIRLRQVLIILLDNAIKFTSAGVVTVRVQVLAENPSFLRLEVEDSGCGISADLTERIFERLYQVNNPDEAGRKGLGLGLYICRELVEGQGGRIWVTSEPRKGSIFYLTVPVFSLADLLAPLLQEDGWPGDSVALVTIEIRAPNGWLSKESRDECSRGTRTLVQRCLLPDLDVLLPKTGSSGPGEIFQIVAFADEKGVAVLIKRIRDQFQRLEACKGCALAFSTSYTLLERYSASAATPTEPPVDEMARKIENLIELETSERTI